MDELFDTIRENAGKEIWSRGVELARRDAVSGESSSEGEIVVRVFDRSRGIGTRVTLWPHESDWSRDCTCKMDPCPHVAAAIIALRRAQEQGSVLPTSEIEKADLHYAFRRQQGFLDFERIIVHAGGRDVLNVPLASLASGKWGNYALALSETDLSIEHALGGDRRGRLKAATMMRLLPLLSAASVSLDGERCAIQKTALGIAVSIRDEGLGIFVQGRRDARIRETFHNGAVLTEAGLHPQADLSFEGDELEILRRGKAIPLRDIERFASEVLPQWSKRFTIENRARNLPEFVHADPEVELEYEQRGQGLLVRAGLVYGQPPIARISEGIFRPTGGKVPVRDHDAERRLRDELWRNWGIDLYRERYYPPEEAIHAAAELARWRGAHRGVPLRHFQVHEGLQPSVLWDAGRIAVSWEIAPSEGYPSGQKASSEQLLDAWRKGESLVPLLEGGFARLPADFMQRHGQLICDLLAAQEEREELPRAVLPQVLELFEDLDLEAPADLAAFARWAPLDATQGPALPPGFQATLRNYQLEGVSWLQHMRKLSLGALLADDMGLGKTVQTIAALPSGSLIIAPTSVLPNWQKELRRFRPQLRVCLYHGSARHYDSEADVIVTSYGLLRQEPERFTSQRYEMVVLDEAQMIKNPESKMAQAAQQLTAAARIALSGTPIENSLDDLWSLFAFLNPGLLGGRRYFRERWSRPIQDGQEAVALKLRQLLRPFILRRLKQDVAPELPPRIEKVLYAELWPEERRLYEAIFAATRQDLVDKLQAGGSVFEVLEALLRMRQACCHPALIPSQEAAQSSKLTLLAETLTTTLSEGHKALVFSQWTSLLDLLEPILRRASIDFLRLDGGTRDRQAIVDAFQNEAGPPVLIMSLKAGGVGLNLTRADHVFILDPWWNPAAADQAADRAHRIGQDRTVMIHPLVALDTVEEKIMELQNRKRALAAAALGEGAPLPALTREDMLYLLQENAEGTPASR